MTQMTEFVRFVLCCLNDFRYTKVCTVRKEQKLSFTYENFLIKLLKMISKFYVCQSYENPMFIRNKMVVTDFMRYNSTKLSVYKLG